MSGQEIRANLGKNVKNLRARRQFSQANLAEKANISIAYLSKIERGLKFPKPDILSQLAESLNVEVYELFKSNNISYSVSAAVQKENKNHLKHLSQDIIKQVNLTMERVSKKHLK
jgi:transcriptional regulator with XRE-family HTH domain